MAFRDAILQSPEHDLPRLVYADWLDEQGDPLGEFIRIQCELEKIPWYDPRGRPLRRREMQLLTEHRRTWLGSLLEYRVRSEFHRGFPSCLSLTADEFVKNSADFIELAPIQSARLRITAFDSDWERLADCEDLKRLRSLSLHWRWLSPCPSFPQQLENLIELDLAEAPIFESTLSALFEPIVFKKLRSLSLANVPTTPGVLAQLSASPVGRGLNEVSLPFLPPSKQTVRQILRLLSHGNLERLELPNAAAFADGRIWEFLASDSIASLKVLSLEGASLSEADVFGLISAPTLSRLEELHLKNLELSDSGTALPKVLNAGLTNLKSLDLSNSACSALVPALLKSEVLSNLVWLRLEGNPIPAEAMEALAASGCLSRFGELVLRKCHLGAEELRPLLETSDWGVIDELQLGMNPLGDAGVALLAECPHLEQIRKLNLRSCGITASGAKALAKSLYTRNLEELNLDDNQIDDRGARVLALSPNWQNLQALSLRRNRISEKAQRELGKVFGTLRLAIN